MSVVKVRGVDYATDIVFLGNTALTLDPKEVCENHNRESGEHTRLHADGWEITGVIIDDGYYWVNRFSAVHLTKGWKVWGDFESEVNATSETAWRKFYEAHPPSQWDYGDI